MDGIYPKHLGDCNINNILWQDSHVYCIGFEWPSLLVLLSGNAVYSESGVFSGLVPNSVGQNIFYC
ncbi:hypothetical protein AB835_04530 [Candidatus Endobugula sertula]|uniref:Uncharacterized protein n=1 Tax=Candidatus Endobugula sertula TaxID=62101 RepID=A0A1D2QRU0_9GAMM|nr:hypothetical protein AB835_04530 [Candidatus Endobugula sertula]